MITALKTSEGSRAVSNDRPAAAVRARGLSPRATARMRDAMQRHVDSGLLPGLVALVSRRDAEHVEAIGSLAFQSNVPMRRDTIFRLASTTKPITAVAAMILVEECKLRLDDPVDPWLPELANRKVLRRIDGPLDDTVPAKRAITLRDLLTFRAGYGEVLFLAGNCPMQQALSAAELPLSRWPFVHPSDELMKRLGTLPLVHQPGERWLYHMGAEILGVLIARASGKSLGTFLRERIFEPLGMKDTDFSVPDSKVERFSVCYFTHPATGEVAVLDPAVAGLYAGAPIFESGAGGLVSTADDLLAFGRMLLRQGAYGKDRILARPTVELMVTDQLTPEQKGLSPFFPNFWDARGWGLGVSVVTRRTEPGRSVGSFGWDGAFGTSLYVDPSEDLVGILMIQRQPELLQLPAVVLDFWTSAYQLIDD